MRSIVSPRIRGGYITAAQARQMGVSHRMLSHHARNGRFQRVARGVYRLSHFPASPFEDLYIAWLRTGPRSVISHKSALAVYGLSELPPGEEGAIDLAIAARWRSL